MTNIFVGNLSFQTTQDELHALFAPYGNVERVNIITDRDSGSKKHYGVTDGWRHLQFPVFPGPPGKAGNPRRGSGLIRMNYGGSDLRDLNRVQTSG